MNNLKPYTLEDFRAMVDQMIEDATDPASEVNLLLVEGRHYVVESAKFDMEFARKMGLVVSSIEDLLNYAKNRKEIC